MPFFESLEGFNHTGLWTILVKMNPDKTFKVNIAMTPENGQDKVAAILPGMNFSGTALDLDTGLFEALKKPVQDTIDLVADVPKTFGSRVLGENCDC